MGGIDAGQVEEEHAAAAHIQAVQRGRKCVLEFELPTADAVKIVADEAAAKLAAEEAARAEAVRMEAAHAAAAKVAADPQLRAALASEHGADVSSYEV